MCVGKGNVISNLYLVHYTADLSKLNVYEFNVIFKRYAGQSCSTLTIYKVPKYFIRANQRGIEYL